MSTDVEKFFSELDGGVFEEKLSAIISEVAGSVVDTNKQGKIIIELDIKRIGNSYQVNVDSKLKFKRPTMNGDSSGTRKTATAMHVGTNGRLSLFPENQDQMFTKRGDVNIDHSTGEIKGR